MGLFKKAIGAGVETTCYTITSKTIPRAFSGFKILHLSDFHCAPKKGILLSAKQVSPDVIFMTGDMVDDKLPYGSFLKLLEAFLHIAPVYIISGNHDAYRSDLPEIIDICKGMGAVYLEDRTVTIEKDGSEIFLHGISDPGIRTPEKLDSKIKDSISQLDRKDGYEILLFHRANKLHLFEDENFDLILSGHMHGGQMRLPYLGGIVAPKSCFADSKKMFFPDFSGGQYKFGKTDIIVNRGMGNPVPLPRFGNPTEIVSITLMSQI